MLLGGVILFRVDDSPYGTTSFWLVLAIAGSLGLIAMFVVDAHLAGAAPAGARRRRDARRRAGDRRSRGLHPSGQVLVHGERWQAAARPAGSAEPGERVRVTGQRGLVLEVEREPRRRSPCAT